MAKWIEVEDRLPKYGEPVLYRILYQADQGGMYSETSIVVTGELALEEDGPAWIMGSRNIMWDYDFNLGFSMDDVTHWKPIIEPLEYIS